MSLERVPRSENADFDYAVSVQTVDKWTQKLLVENFVPVRVSRASEIASGRRLFALSPRSNNGIKSYLITARCNGTTARG